MNILLSGEINIDIKIHSFLRSNGVTLYKIEAMPADCSLRRYYRVFTENDTFILMDSTFDDSLGRFIDIDKMLNLEEINAPGIIAIDLEKRMVLLEDFGNDTVTKYLRKHPEQEETIYMKCLNVLQSIAEIKYNSSAFELYDGYLIQKELEVFCQWYLKQRVLSENFEEARASLMSIFESWHEQFLNATPQIVVLRDFMADNLMVLETEEIGLLDFQDAVIGSCVYDLVSLLEDARREVSEEVTNKLKSLYKEHLKVEEGLFEKCYTIFGLQRNLKIVGIFHRRNIQDGQHRYLDYLPLVWKHITNALKKEEAASLRAWFNDYRIGVYE